MTSPALNAATISRIEKTLKLIDREVWAITARDQFSRGGLTATWVSQASINRAHPTLLIGLAPNHATAKLVLKSQRFVAHLLRSDQSHLAYQLAASSGAGGADKLGEFSTIGDRDDDAPPLLANCLAWLDCRVFHYYDCGDRWFFWADIIDSGTPIGAEATDAAPLREQSFFQSLSPKQRGHLVACRDAELPLHQSWHEAWRVADEETQNLDDDGE